MGLTETKLVLCAYEGCAGRRVHYERPDTLRPHQLVKVAADYEGPAYCSMECAMYAGALSVRT